MVFLNIFFLGGQSQKGNGVFLTYGYTLLAFLNIFKYNCICILFFSYGGEIKQPKSLSFYLFFGEHYCSIKALCFLRVGFTQICIGNNYNYIQLFAQLKSLYLKAATEKELNQRLLFESCVILLIYFLNHKRQYFSEVRKQQYKSQIIS